jgi:His/Glu/Gln/Arg/opine family amino acid ABC transporter permease subunit
MTTSFFSGLNWNDAWFLAEATWRTVQVSAVGIISGTVLGVMCGWALAELRRGWTFPLSSMLDVFRSVPLLIQLVLFYNFFPIIGLPLDGFTSGAIVLALYTAALVANVARGGIESVDPALRRASRSLGFTYFQDLRHVVFPVGLRSAFPSWISVALSVIKDSALVSVIGYVELLKASQILITRTQEPFLILAIAGFIYFAISWPLSCYGRQLERKWL